MFLEAELKCYVSNDISRSNEPPVSVCPGNPGAVGAAPANIEHHQAGAEEEPAGGAGCAEVLRLQRDCEQSEIHELHLGR